MSKRTATVRIDDGEGLYASILSRLVIRTLADPLYAENEALRSLHGALRSRNWRAVISAVESLEIQEYSSVVDYYVKTQLVALVKKLPFTSKHSTGHNPRATAWKKFSAAEHRCKRVNQRSALLRYGVGFAYGDKVVSARRYIRKVIGDKPDIKRVYELCDWGPGASVGVHGNRTNLARKFLARRWTCTPLALSYATQALWSNDQFRALLSERKGDFVCYDREKFAEVVRARVELVTHNNITFVPKSYKVERPIATEPLLNGFLQKGVDQYMRELLARSGIDLRYQEPNQALALEGSRGGFNPYATLDLASASDSVSIGVAKTLLPPAWFEFLNSLRAHQYAFRGKKYTYEKFVSMGNGFCFPLETLIFAAVCHAICESHGSPDDFSVYGDDIIVRQSEALAVIEFLRWLGFRTNPDKTNVVGPFRESCGADWYSGQDVRPVYVDYWFRDNRDLYKFHNSTLRGPLPFNFFTEVRDELRKACDPEVRFVRPYHGNADSAFTVEKDIAMSSKFVSWDRRTWAWRWLELKTTSVPDKLEGFGDPRLCCELRYLAVLRGSSSRMPLTVRRKTRVSVRTCAYWGLLGSEPWRGADPDRP